MSTTDTDIEQLNSFLRGELSAVETYQQCIDKVKSPQIGVKLEELQMSHQSRAKQLQARITSLGGQPSTKAGVWGGVAKLVEGGAALFGESSAVSALEEGEDHGLNEYRQDLDNLSLEQQTFVREQLLPEQQRTHDILSAIDSRM